MNWMARMSRTPRCRKFAILSLSYRILLIAPTTTTTPGTQQVTITLRGEAERRAKDGWSEATAVY